MHMEINEAISMKLILHSGNARSSSFEALALVKQDELILGNQKITEAKEELLLAQKIHAQLLRSYANEEEIKLDLLLMHAEDHIASTQVNVELIAEMIEMYERFGERR